MPTSGRRKRVYSVFLAMLLLMALSFVLMHDLLGGSLLSSTAWNSYTLQALAWREGRLDLDSGCTWLELAVYGGKYYVSFPPFPSVVILPLTFIFGEHTPDNLIVAMLSLASASLIYFLAVRRFSPRDSALIALSLTWGSNLLWLSLDGGVWFMAQSMCFLLLVLALRFALDGKRVLAYLMVAFAVGCRPFTALMFIPLFVWFYMCDANALAPKGFTGFLRTALRQWVAWLPVLAVAAAYMGYNFARFGNPLEFGHNYLPEFTESPLGQFNVAYIWNNLSHVLFRPVTLKEGLALDYSVFDGFMFYVANPFYILSFVSLVRAIIKRRADALTWALAISQLLMLLALCMHKTFGGWQFGARYTVDMLPAALALLLHSASKEGKGRASLRTWERAVIIAGVAFNIYGSLAMRFLNG